MRASRALDYLQTDPTVDARHLGIEGVSRYGKAALVTMAFDTRFALVLIGSSGEGGTKQHRRNFGEAVENPTGSGEYHWMAGHFLHPPLGCHRLSSLIGQLEPQFLCKARFLNVNDNRAHPGGRRFPGKMNAVKLHLAEPACQAWADALTPIFYELLWPPATDDHSPPPTGDPGAQR